MTRAPALIVLISKYSFPVLLAAFALLYLIRNDLYRLLIREDQSVEWLTFFFLLASGLVSLLCAIGISRKHGYRHWFFLFFFGFSFLAGLEEISWGQRVFGWQTNALYAQYNDQQETNLHNTVQAVSGLRTKNLTWLVLFVYGVVLPWLAAKKKWQHPWISNKRLIIPPTYLSLGFLLATLLMVDLPTGREEEIGELFFSMCFLLMTLHYYQVIKHTQAFQQSGK